MKPLRTGVQGAKPTVGGLGVSPKVINEAASGPAFGGACDVAGDHAFDFDCVRRQRVQTLSLIARPPR